MLTFCRRKAIVADKPEPKLVDPKSDSEEQGDGGDDSGREETMDKEEHIRQRNAACDAQGMAKF